MATGDPLDRAPLFAGYLQDRRTTVALCGRVAAQGGASMSEAKPAFQPNDAALMLLQSIAQDMAAMRADVSALQQDRARTDGLNLDGRLKELSGELKDLKAKVTELETQRRADLAQRKPWLFILQEATKIAVAAAGGALAFSRFPPHH